MLKGCEGSRPRPRDRIVEMARQLFRQYGLRGIGVDAIAEAAGTNKMTLYRHFASKDDLIVTCLREVETETDAMWEGFEAAHPNDPMAQLHDWVRRAAECAVAEGRGCDIANAAAELTDCNHPAHKVIEQFKKHQHERLAKLCHDAGVGQAELLADTLSLLIEGARVNWQSVGPDGPGARFVGISEAVIESFSKA
ncbi:MAG: TetR/AcrR family transcriptional regulator [Beijerinckiaceae bacterium]|nr:MAG: TetR/AcrR family transcriptional regulator [Beijerinckiaceae bacterium]